MKLRTIRAFLVVALMASALFAGWSWLRPYAWNVDPGARCKVVGAQVRKDLSFYWLDVHLKFDPGQTHDLMKPVRLRTSAGRVLEPADTTLVGGPDQDTRELWLKFWLETADVDGSLDLQINDGRLSIKANPGAPELGRANLEYFVTNHW